MIIQRESQLFRTGILILPALLFAVFAAPRAQAQTDVLSWHNDAARTGQNLTEAILTPANVNSSTFGLIANVVVDGKVDAQPLYVSGLDVKGFGTHNVLYIATEHDSVYAVNADTGSMFWKVSLLGSGETTSDTRSCGQVTPEIGITATPAIDRAAGPHGTLYAVAMSKDGSGNYYQRIHALDLSTGAEEFSGPVTVKATYPGTGAGSSGGTVTFAAAQYKERPGLFVLNGNLYTSWGSHCDAGAYAGWLIAYKETTLAQTAVFDFAPTGSDAALWNAGAAPAVDSSGNIYVATANGTFDTTLTSAGFPNHYNFGNSLVKLKLSGTTLVPEDYWSMDNSDAESEKDVDLGSGGIMLLPVFTDASKTARHLAVAAGKDHNIYIADTANMGHYDKSANATIYQVLTNALSGGAWSSPAYFNSRVYYGSVGQNLSSFTVSQAKLLASPVQTTSTTFEYPGATPSISANGTADGIVWAAENSSPAILHAYDAANLSTEFYNSSQAANSRDQFGSGNKFIVPTIANGKVYVGTTNSVGIFGLLRLTKPVLPDGDYSITSDFSKLVVNAPSATGTAIDQNKSGSTNALWFFSTNGDGFYTIQNVSTKLFLTDLAGSSGDTLEQSPTAHDGAQLWSLNSTASGYVIQNQASGLVLDAVNATAGPNLTLTTANSTTNQAWKIQ